MADLARFAAKRPLLIKISEDQSWFVPPLSAGVELGIRHLQSQPYEHLSLFYAQLIALAVKNPILDPDELQEEYTELFLSEIANDILREFPLWEPSDVKEPKESPKKWTSDFDPLEFFVCWVAFWWHTPLGTLLEDTMANIQSMAKHLPRMKDEYFINLQAATAGGYKPSGEVDKSSDFSRRMGKLKTTGDAQLAELNRRLG